ncbi:MAG: DNA gyrase inhibitor YacG [Phycisphaerae bacterium]
MMYRCSICGKPVTTDESLPTLYPFCSERCKLVDLGKWLRGEYAVDRDLSPDDLPEGDDPRDGDARGRR